MLEHGSNGRCDANNRIYDQAMDCVRRFTVSLIVVAIKKNKNQPKKQIANCARMLAHSFANG